MFEQIVEFFENTDPILGALYATLFTWGLTALGASFVFLFKTMTFGVYQYLGHYVFFCLSKICTLVF